MHICESSTRAKRDDEYLEFELIQDFELCPISCDSIFWRPIVTSQAKVHSPCQVREVATKRNRVMNNWHSEISFALVVDPHHVADGFFSNFVRDPTERVAILSDHNEVMQIWLCMIVTVLGRP